LSSIGQIIDDVEIALKSMEELHKDTEDANLTEEEEARAVIREDREQVSLVDSRGIANDKNAEISYLLNDDTSRVNNEEVEECSDSDHDSNDELIEGGLERKLMMMQLLWQLRMTTLNLRKIKSATAEKLIRRYLYPWGITDLWLRMRTRLVANAH